MLDIKFIKENPDFIKEATRKKHLNFDVKKLLEVEERRIQLLSLVESHRAEHNKVNEEISRTNDPKTREQLIIEMRGAKDHLKDKEDELKKIMKEWQILMLQVPNVPDMTVPEGQTDEDNQEIKIWGEKPRFDFEPKDHITLMQDLNLADFERGTKVHGFRGYLLIEDGVRLSFAIWNYALDFFQTKGFSLIIPPVIVRREGFLGTGYLPEGEEDLYKTQDGDFLAGTSEVPIMSMHSGEIFDKKSLPKKYLGFSPCFRREAGSHGKDVNGLIRVHEFYKLEQIILCEANHETSVRFHEEMNRNIEEFIESLNIPYRTVINCGGDLGLAQVKKYDVELWVPKEKKYREIGSASYFHDFQTRRLGIRYKEENGKIYHTHSLNATAIPTPRILVSLIENNQQADGSIMIPKVLRKYLGKDFIKKL
ncbi:serine--tRNA ligase [Candidatus Nomurabacteria bacterium RIFCSPLOWO2_01_FULL_33_24]|uniref:Serine--tRNA ligase n=1 Tax=Candidatus Nomurabacteria bacterium RIFCSPLOWO2_01_FULL_33_24 TaxID=1801765 RepID=A0A1F6X0V9_9BACT|nr:MAG: serine--tRNA ligase [Candidatus Nomurabacteria bacterium RIFCSPLOWO2_01_FULL_33_24]